MEDKDLGFCEMQKLQKMLQEKYKGKWEPVAPETARQMFLWMFIEAGEAADVLKKNGCGRIMEDPEVRGHFIEELCDVLMYFNDIMLCCSISPEELRRVYLEKQKRNLERW